MSGFTVDVARLAQLLARIASFESTLQEHLTQIDGRVQALSTSWTGSAARDAARAHEDWRHGAAQMQSAMATMRGAVLGAHDNYALAMSMNQRGWSA